MNIKNLVMAVEDELIELRRDFHKHPELGLKEFKTSKKIKSYLDRLGLKTRFCGGTGVIGGLEGELNEQGFGWILPFIVGGIIGMFMLKNKSRE